MKHAIAPKAPFSWVADGLAIGGIVAYGEDLSGFGLCLNVAQEIASGDPKMTGAGGCTTCGNTRFTSRPFGRGQRACDICTIKGVPLRHARLDDIDEIASQVPEILRAVALVADVRGRGAAVLVTCAQGRNRSALVVAEYLCQLGNAPADIVAKIQARRANSLMNGAFVAWLHRAR